MRERARAIPKGQDYGRLYLCGRPKDRLAQTAGSRWHGLPALRVVSASLDHGELVDGASQSAWPQQGRGPTARAETTRSRGPALAERQIPRPTFRRPAAARG